MPPLAPTSAPPPAPIERLVASDPAVRRSATPIGPDRRERRLIRGLHAGDPAALRELHEAYGATVFGFLRAALPDRGDAEDVFQLVMCEAWRRGGAYDPERGPLLAWIMMIARSRAIDERRRRRPRPDEAALAGLADHADPGAGLDALVERWRIAHLLGLLPEEEAELLRLRFYTELSQTEIAERTGLALGTIKSRMVRGLERLRGLIEAEDDLRAPTADPRPAPVRAPAAPRARR